MTGSWLSRLRAAAGRAVPDGRRFMIYYGHVTPDILAKLGTYELAVVEPAHWSAEQVRALRAAGAKTIGYVSVLEWPAWNAKRGERLRPSDFLRRGGERVHFPEWDSYLMDLREPHYRALLTEEVESCVGGKAMDGVFLDTVGDLDDASGDPLLWNELLHAYLGWLAELKAARPELWIMQNRGFRAVEAAAPMLNAFLWEDWRAELAADGWGKERLRLLERLRRDGGLELFAVGSRLETAAQDGAAAAKRGMHFLARSGDYVSWPADG